MDHIVQDANQWIGHEYNAGLIIDESGVVTVSAGFEGGAYDPEEADEN